MPEYSYNRSEMNFFSEHIYYVLYFALFGLVHAGLLVHALVTGRTSIECRKCLRAKRPVYYWFYVFMYLLTAVLFFWGVGYEIALYSTSIP